MKPFVIIAALLSAGCPKPNPPPSGPTAESIYQALVAGGCLAPDDGGAAAVDQEHAMPTPEVWIQCMYTEGGTVVSCAVPCDAAAATLKRSK